MKILTIGDNCIDAYVNQEIGYPGGGCVNVAVHAARHKACVSYIGAVGVGRLGRHLLDCLNKEDVDTSKVQKFAGSTAIAFVDHFEKERIFLGSDRGVRYLLDASKINSDYIKEFDLVHTTLDGQVDKMISKWYNMGVRISYDFSHRYLSEQLELLPFVEYAFFSGGDQDRYILEERAQEFYNCGCKNVIITRGEKGSFAYNGREYIYQKAIDTDLMDTLGCGDAFIAAFLCTMQNGGSISNALLKGSKNASASLMQFGGFGRGKPFTELGVDITNYEMYKTPRK